MNNLDENFAVGVKIPLSSEIHDGFMKEIKNVHEQLEILLPGEIPGNIGKIAEKIFGNGDKNKQENKYPFLDMIFLINTKEDDSRVKENGQLFKIGDQVYKGIPGKGVTKGMVYGFLMWLVGALSGIALMPLYMTISIVVVVYWIIQALVVNVINGAIIGAVYKQK